VPPKKEPSPRLTAGGKVKGHVVFLSREGVADPLRWKAQERFARLGLWPFPRLRWGKGGGPRSGPWQGGVEDPRPAEGPGALRTPGPLAFNWRRYAPPGKGEKPRSGFWPGPYLK
jgi:hypothetical protein